MRGCWAGKGTKGAVRQNQGVKIPLRKSVFWLGVKRRKVGRANGLFPAWFVVEPQRTPRAPGGELCPPNPMGFSASHSIPQAGQPSRCRHRPGPRDSRPARRSDCFPAWHCPTGGRRRTPPSRMSFPWPRCSCRHLQPRSLAPPCLPCRLQLPVSCRMDRLVQDLPVDPNGGVLGLISMDGPELQQQGRALKPRDTLAEGHLMCPVDSGRAVNGAPRVPHSPFLTPHSPPQTAVPPTSGTTRLPSPSTPRACPPPPRAPRPSPRSSPRPGPSKAGAPR